MSNYVDVNRIIDFVKSEKCSWFEIPTDEFVEWLEKLPTIQTNDNDDFVSRKEVLNLFFDNSDIEYTGAEVCSMLRDFLFVKKKVK